MAKKKGSGSAGILGAIGLGVIAMIATIPREVWLLIIGVGVAWLVYTILKNTWGKSSPSQNEDSSLRTGGTTATPAAWPVPSGTVGDSLGAEPPLSPSKPQLVHRIPPTTTGFFDGSRPASTTHTATSTLRADEAATSPVTVRPPADPPTRTTEGFRIPSSPAGYGPGRWIPPGESVRIHDVIVPGGFIYVGTSLAAASGGTDPCLINPSLPVQGSGNYSQREFGYWPSYSEVSPEARYSYLRWLADGRSSPDSDIGYVFVFLYGLERRVLLDAQKDATAEAEMPAIADEIRRLLGTYGEKSGSFKRYASTLLDLVSVFRFSKKLYLDPVPAFTKTYELPLYIRLALGQSAVDKAPVPAALALAWARLDPNVYLRTPAVRCSEQFEQLFPLKYAEAFGEGLVLPHNRTKLKLVYLPASAGFRGSNITLSFGDTPDVTALTAPLKKIQLVVEAATKELESYSRFLGRNPDAGTALEGLLQLPTTLWPEPARRALDGLRNRMGDGMVALPFKDLLETFGPKTSLSRDRVHALAKALNSANIGVEPDVLGDARHPKPEDTIVLFSFPPSEAPSHATPAYQAAALTLQLASAVATADGEFTAKEMSVLAAQVQSWNHLPPSLLRRLLAHLRLLVSSPASLASIKKKLEPLDESSRETVAAFMATVAQSDGEVTPAEVKMLERVYKALGVDAKKVFGHVHAAAAGSGTPVANARSSGFKLDPARIAELQQDTARVNALLTEIFKDDNDPVPTAPIPEIPQEEVAVPSGLLGLDEAHTALARLLLSRPKWSRAELQDAAADLELMADGALERINEASFDNLDIAFTEGDDPVEVNAEVLEKIAA